MNDDISIRLLALERAIQRLENRTGALEVRMTSAEQQLNKLASGAGGPTGGSSSGQWAATGGGIPAGNLASPGSGSVTLYGDNGAGLVAGTTATAYNVYGTAIAASKTVWLEPFAGKLYVITTDC
jgi:hypothetical protein